MKKQLGGKTVELLTPPQGLKSIGGSACDNLNNVLANQTIRTLWLPPGTSDNTRDASLSAAIAAMMEFKPADGVEGMMAAQAVGLHSAAMECLRRAMIPEQSGEACDQLRRQAVSLTRTFLDVVAALDRKRGKGGHQVVRVERVMVAPGGKAIIGNVQAGSRRGEGVGHDETTEGEPYAPPAALAHNAAPGAILPPVWGANPGRDALPVTRDAQRPVPDARGGLDGA